MMKKGTFIVFGVLLIASYEGSAFAGDTLLRLAQRTALARGANATEKQKDLEQKVHDAEDRAKQKVAELGQQVSSLEKNAESAVLADLASGKSAIVQELQCSLQNIKDNTNVKGSIQISKNDGGAQRAVINLANLFSGDTSRQNLGLGFSSFADDGKTLRFDLIDLTNGSVIKTGKFEELGLGDVTSNCDLSQRIVAMKDGAVQVDVQSLEKKTISNTEDFVKDTIQKAKEAN